MKNSYGIYYLIIVFLVIMMFVPPLFRMLIPKEENPTTTSQTITQLTCNQIKVIADKNVTIATTTTYINTTLASIKFAYTKLDTPDMTDSFISTFESWKNIMNAKYNEVENSILFNYRNYDFSKETSLSIYSGDINTQKQYYESQGFTCDITNN